MIYGTACMVPVCRMPSATVLEATGWFRLAGRDLSPGDEVRLCWPDYERLAHCPPEEIHELKEWA